MMSMITFDTLKFVKRLEAAGASSQLAEALAEAQQEVFAEALHISGDQAGHRATGKPNRAPGDEERKQVFTVTVDDCRPDRSGRCQLRPAILLSLQ